jgi:hypothetical protein
MMTQVFQAPRGGNWCGSAQNSNTQGKASSAFWLSPERNSSTSSGVAEASQAAPDFSSGLVKVECPPGSDVAGDLLAELVNFSPFLQHGDRHRAQGADRFLCRFYFAEFPGLYRRHRAFKLNEGILVKPLCRPEQILLSRNVPAEPHCHPVPHPLMLPPHEGNEKAADGGHPGPLRHFF